ncbi:hypothetical protein ASPFODRAFT_42536 [Aspergillus luchuensis CBS 106.47]|uniref:Beta-lactamase-related domain-containing protein n=1 Tax=Aspergillus luchuensis (strain CBS 106.47) TaxID=1137211 RepID=A0A1M3TRL5_ASPLC|nr:hypothetical protein ASPFODRAFT_42536 [Aspergillus luchuensis CBS 106.47]
MSLPPLIQGHCAPPFSPLRDTLTENLQAGEELGFSLSVTVGNETVVDLWGGYADAARTQPWTANTITCIFSSSKVITNLAANMLIDKGLLDPSAPVARYWPEFAANGKETILVKHVLSHTAGLPAWELPITLEEICDTPVATAKLAAQQPWWSPPGSHLGYHPATQGVLVGELVRRITGQSLGAFVQSEIAEPLGADYRLGVLPADEKGDPARVAEMVPQPQMLSLEGLDPASIMMRTTMGSPIPPQAVNGAGAPLRRTELGGTNGFSNARAMARIGSMVANGGQLDGKRFLSPETINRILEPQVDAVDSVMGKRMSWGLGWALPTSGNSYDLATDGRVAYWEGWGGSILIMDLDRKMCIAYAMNKMGASLEGDSRTQAYVKQIYQIVRDMQNAEKI